MLWRFRPKQLYAYSDQATKDGLSMRPVTAPRPVGVLLGLEGSQSPFAGTPNYKSIAHLPRPERVRMQDPEVRAKILSEEVAPTSASSSMPAIRLGSWPIGAASRGAGRSRRSCGGSG